MVDYKYQMWPSAVQVPVSLWPSWPPTVTVTSVTLRPSEAEGSVLKVLTFGDHTVVNHPKTVKILENIRELTETYGCGSKPCTPSEPQG